jgi:hypothetical protein
MYNTNETDTTAEAAFTHLLETHFIPLAMNKGSSSSSTTVGQKANIKVVKGKRGKRGSAVAVNIEKVGTEIVENTKPTKHRRTSTAKSAAEALEIAISHRSSITKKTSSNEERLFNLQLLSKYDKPLKRVFTFYTTLTKVAPNGSSVPSNVVRTHLTYQDTQILLRDFYLLPAYVSNSAFQEIWHDNQLGRDHNEFINWLSFVEFKHLLNTVSHQIPLPKKNKATSDEDDRVPSSVSVSSQQLGRLLSNMDRGISNMQKRGASFLPRFHPVTWEYR